MQKVDISPECVWEVFLNEYPLTLTSVLSPSFSLDPTHPPHMAVDAHHLSRFNHQQQQLMSDRDILMSAVEGNMMMYDYSNRNTGNQQMAGIESFLPAYGSTAAVMQAKNQASMKDDSGLTYAIPSMMQRKRPRDQSGSVQSFAPAAAYQKVESFSHSRSNNLNTSFSFLGEDISLQIMHQQLDIGRFINQHMEKVRMEIEARRKRNSRRMIEVVKEGILKRLKAKEDEIEKINRLNWALEERVRSLSVDNQIWRELAQTNEATANALRANLEEVLAQVTEMRAPQTSTIPPINNLNDDAESCCGSSSPEFHAPNNNSNLRGADDEEGWRAVSSSWPVQKTESRASGLCRRCGKAEACVLLMTCRHLCLCAGCGSGGTTCPVCKSVNDATLIVNLSA